MKIIGESLYSFDHGASVSKYDISSPFEPKLIRKLPILTVDEFTCVHISLSEKYFFLLTKRNKIQRFDLKTAQKMGTLERVYGIYLTNAFDVGGQGRVCRAHHMSQKIICIHNFDRAKTNFILKKTGTTKSNVIKNLERIRRFVMTNTSLDVELFNLQSNKKINTRNVAQQYVTSVFTTSQSSIVGLSGWFKKVVLVDVERSLEILYSIPILFRIYTVAVSRDHSRIAIAGDESTVLILN